MDSSVGIIDVFKRDYAKLAKYILIGRSCLQINLIETIPLTKNLASMALQKLGQAGFELMKPYMLSLGSMVLATGPLGIAAGLAVAVFAAGCFLYYDYTHPKKTLKLEGQLTKCIVDDRVIRIRSQVKAYIQCSETIEKIKSLYQVDSDKPSRDGIERMIANREYLKSQIESSMFKDLDISTQIEIAELYYMLAKITIQLYAVRWNKELPNYLAKLQKEHKEIRITLKKSIQSCIKINKNHVVIQGELGNLQFEDTFQKCTPEILADFIFQEIFKCSYTQNTISYMYRLQFWQRKQKFDTNFQLNQNNTSIVKYLGNLRTKYNNTFNYPGNIITKLGFNQNKKNYGVYYQDTKTKSGSHDHTYADIPNKNIINFKDVCAIYIDTYKKKTGRLNYLNYQSQSFVIGQFPIQITDNFCFCLELQSIQTILSIQQSCLSDLKLTTCKKNKQNFNKKLNRDQFHGYIQTLQSKMRLGYGCRNKWLLNLVKGYTFHGIDNTDEAQKLIFSDISVLKTDQSGNIQKFCCRINTQYDKTQFMVRDNRDTDSSVFGNNKSGGEIIQIQFIKRIAKNTYLGHIYVNGYIKFRDEKRFSTYESNKGEFQWTINKIKNQKNVFQIYFDQEQ